MIGPPATATRDLVGQQRFQTSPFRIGQIVSMQHPPGLPHPALKIRGTRSSPVYLVVDGHPAHRSKLVKQFVASTDGQLKLFVLPAYSPQLNPDEWVWKNVKHDRVGRTSVTGPDEFKAKIVSALRRLQKMPHIVRAFFADPTCATSPHDQVH